MEPRAPDYFFGYLGRIDYASDRAFLRFYPFGFSRNLSDAPVFSLNFERPGFVESDVAALMAQDAEVELRVRDNLVEIDDVLSGTSMRLEAEGVLQQWSPYDVEDYARYLARLDEANHKLHNDLRAVRTRVTKATNFAGELLRRAEIKAAGSEALKLRQASAIEALNQLLNVLEGDI